MNPLTTTYFFRKTFDGVDESLDDVSDGGVALQDVSELLHAVGDGVHDLILHLVEHLGRPLYLLHVVLLKQCHGDDSDGDNWGDDSKGDNGVMIVRATMGVMIVTVIMGVMIVTVIMGVMVITVIMGVMVITVIMGVMIVTVIMGVMIVTVIMGVMIVTVIMGGGG